MTPSAKSGHELQPKYSGIELSMILSFPRLGSIAHAVIYPLRIAERNKKNHQKPNSGNNALWF